MSKRIFKFFTFTVLLIISSFALDAQSLDWILKPKITDIDEIVLDHTNTRDKDYRIIKVKKDRKTGFKSANNKLIVPITLEKGGQIWPDQHMSGMVNKKQVFWDRNGKEVPKDVPTKLSKENWYKNEDLKKQKEIDRLESNLGVFVRESTIEVEGYSGKMREQDNYIIEYPGGEIITSSRNLESTYVTADKCLVSQWEGHLVLYDRMGEVIDTIKSGKIWEKENGNYYIESRRLKGYYNSKLEPVLPLEDRNFRQYEDLGVISFKDAADKGFLIDMSGNEIFTVDNVENIWRLKKNDFLYIYTKDKKTILYDINTKTRRDIDFKLDRNPSGKILVVEKDGKEGIYDIVNDKMIMDFTYDYVSKNGAVFTAYDFAPLTPEQIEKKKKKKRFGSRKPLDGIKYIYSVAGELLQSGKVTVSNYRGGFIISDADKNQTVYSADGAVISLDPGMTVRAVNDGHFVKIIEGDNEFVVLAKDFLLGDFSSSYDAGSKPIMSKDKKNTYYEVKKEDKYGLINGEGKVIIPLKLDKMDVKKSDGLILAMYKNKWGILKSPIM